MAVNFFPRPQRINSKNAENELGNASACEEADRYARARILRGALSRRNFLTGSLGVATGFIGASTWSPPTAWSQGGSLILVVEPEPPNLGLFINPSNSIAIVGSKIYEGLLTYDWSLKPQASLAKTWSVSSDGKTITFELERNVKFHDGQPFTSADVQFTIMKVLKQHHPRGRVTFKSVEAVETPAPHVAVMKLTEPAPYIMSALSGYESPMVPKHILDGADVTTSVLINKPNGTGPFQFVEWQKGQFLRLKRNTNYWKKERPRLDQLAMRFIKDPATRVAALENGEAQYTGLGAVPNVDVARLKTVSSLEVSKKGYSIINPIVQLQINTKREHLSDVRVRRALAYAIDRKFIEDDIWFGNAAIATGPIHSSLKAIGIYTKEGVRNYNVPNGVEAANRLLDEAGVKKGSDGTRFKITLHGAANNGDFQRLGQYLQQAFAKVGVNLVLNFEDFATYLRRVFTNYDFDLMIEQTFTQLDPVIGVHRLYHSHSIQKGIVYVNAHRWSSKETDELMDQGRIEIDPVKREKLYHEFQRLVVDACPVIYLSELQFVNIQSSAYKDLIVSPLGIFDTFEDARRIG